MRSVSVISVVLAGLLLSGCSIPTLETAECSAARYAVRRFYSFHFGNEMRPSPEYVAAREAYLTPELGARLATIDGERDYFTATDDLPKAFRAGECVESGDGRARMRVVLFWRDDTRSDQRQVTADVVNRDGTWLIDNVSE